MMETPALVVVCPPAVLATAVSKWLPLERVLVLSEKLKGALVTAGPTLVPSTLNCTLAVFAEALAVMVIVPETVVPGTGEMMETLGDTGGTGFALLTLMEMAVLAAVCPVIVPALAVSEWLPLERVVVLSE